MFKMVHHCYIVLDLGRSMEFYEKALGFKRFSDVLKQLEKERT